MIGLVAPLEMPKLLIVDLLVPPVDLGMEADNDDDSEGDEEENLTEHEAMIDPDWPPGNLTPWMMGDNSDKISIPDDAPPVEDVTPRTRKEERTGG